MRKTMFALGLVFVLGAAARADVQGRTPAQPVDCAMVVKPPAGLDPRIVRVPPADRLTLRVVTVPPCMKK